MKFKNYLLSKWKKTLDKKISLIRLKHLGTVTRRKKIFATFIDTCISIKKKKFLRFLLLLKPSVVIIPIIKCNNIFYTVLTKQRRIFNGREILEFPAGSIDQNSNPVKAAMQEITEELGIKVKKTQLKKLYNRYIILDSSSTTGKSYYFYFILNKDKNFLNLLNNKNTGNQNEGEKITLIVKRLDKVKKINNVTTIIGSLLIRDKLKLSTTC